MKIYLFTGTGNSYWAARQLGKLATDSGKNPEIMAIDNLSRKDVAPGTGESVTGFIFPTHGFSLPWYMLRFILRFPRGKGRVFLVNTRAGMKMGRLFTPGVSGIAVHLPMIILMLKGYRPTATLPLDTPSNWISIHPGLKNSVVDSIFNRREKELARLWSSVSEGRLFFPLKYLLFIPLDLLLVPVSAGYMIFGRFIMARSYFSDENCDGCGICARRCPVGAIIMKEKRPYWKYSCESCMRCSNICPKRAVNSSVPVMILVTWILLLLVSYTGPFSDLWQQLRSYTGTAWLPVQYLCTWVITMVVSFILYNILFQLKRLSWFSLLLSRTTPMYWWRRYIAPGFRGLY